MIKFEFKELPLKGAYLITPFLSDDNRGSFVKDYSLEAFKANGIDYELKEVFYTYSHRGVLRGMHFQKVIEQPKLVRCILGLVYDVIVDIRPDSPTYKQYMGFYLDGRTGQELLIPAGFAHGYLVIKDSVVSYKCAEKFVGEYDTGFIYDDPDVGIKWPLKENGIDSLILSSKDKELKLLKDYIDSLSK